MGAVLEHHCTGCGLAGKTSVGYGFAAFSAQAQSGEPLVSLVETYCPACEVLVSAVEHDGVLVGGQTHAPCRTPLVPVARTADHDLFCPRCGTEMARTIAAMWD